MLRRARTMSDQEGEEQGSKQDQQKRTEEKPEEDEGSSASSSSREESTKADDEENEETPAPEAGTGDTEGIVVNGEPKPSPEEVGEDEILDAKKEKGCGIGCCC